VQVTADQVMSATSVNLLAYRPPLHQNGSSLEDFEFSDRDDGGSAKGGSDISVSKSAISVDVISVNDANRY